MSNQRPDYEEIVVINFLYDFGMNVEHLNDRDVLEEKIKYYSNFPNYKEGLIRIFQECIKAKNHEYPIKNWYRFVDDGFIEVVPDSFTDRGNEESAYNWFCYIVKLFADILYEHNIITEEEKAKAYVETSLN
ncbi:hypothetical protein [Rickettsiales endosymbiont of Stachyamoeba lipophora]|uniref:hypothetical protein n=1 Tax=Rickettsiales endosymbiont of Stachyamoeba lipophora TaxID=2486578 RepID=UPI000F647589|nr:hypothetical protein [Rickettsiales endosymbiont of Stachyamoeba lipophora]AZL16365.1 hypothetical protein EF513_07490 [Rickettsiales endosymbiont of Stachyamoeba lipophora]